MRAYELGPPMRGRDDLPVLATITVSAPPDVGTCRRSIARLARDTWLGPRVEDVVLATSELASNALEHGSPPVRCRLLMNGSRAVVAVFDARPDAPATHPEVGVAAMTERHRGLSMIEAVSDRCGYAVTGDAGKWVFAEWWTAGPASDDEGTRPTA